MKRFHALVAGVVAASTLLLSPLAQAQFAKPEDAVKYRQAAFTVMGNHMGRLGAMARGARPFDAAAAQASVKVIESMAGLPWEAFTADSAIGNSRVKPEALGNPEFKQLAEKAGAEIAKLGAAAGNLDSLKGAVGAVGGACKACHDKFRKD